MEIKQFKQDFWNMYQLTKWFLREKNVEFCFIILISLAFLTCYTYVFYSVGAIWAIPIVGILHGWRLHMVWTEN